MVKSRFPSDSRRLMLTCIAIAVLVLVIFPYQTNRFFEYLALPAGHIVKVPLEMATAIDRWVGGHWKQYIALQNVWEKNQQLQIDLDLLHGQNTQLREGAATTERLMALLQFKQRTGSKLIAAQVIGHDATNQFRAIIINKGESDGVKKDMGVITPAGVVGRIVKTTGATAVVLLVTDPNNAISGLIQRTRDEGILEGAGTGIAQMKYIPLLATLRHGDQVVTSGFVQDFPAGLAIGTIMHIDKQDGALFKTAEVLLEVDGERVQEVLVIQEPYDQPLQVGERSGLPMKLLP